MPIRTPGRRPLRNGRFFIAAAAALALLAQGGCSEGRPDPDRDASGVIVTAGMTKGEVMETWGRPSLKVRQPSGERWSYWLRDRRNRVVGRAYVVFDEGERVADVVTRGGGWPGSDRHPQVIT